MITAEVLVMLDAVTAEMPGACVVGAGVSKKIPATAALMPPVRVTWIITLPVRFQTAYSPFWKLEKVSMARGALVVPFLS